jgi:selenide,water dikinase
MDNAADARPPEARLTSLAHGGGCGCKLSPALLRELLAGVPAAGAFPNLLVGAETSDDAAVYRLRADLAMVATTDFFTPIVDDPFVFGQIAATNALSDIYAMGGEPVMALALLGMPLGRVSVQTVQAILAGGAAICARAGIPVAGGHSIDSPEPIYGLAAMGTVHPDRVLRNSGAREGDALILTKGLGIGIFSAALKQGRLDAAAYALMVQSTTQLNAIGAALGETDGVHAATDVTGFGLLGHALEICRASGLGARIGWDRVPVLAGAASLAQAGVATGAASRNWASYGDEVALPPALASWQRGLLCDPQTSGGLLIAVAPRCADHVLDAVRAAGFAHAAVVGALAGDVRGIVLRGGE